MFRNLTLILLTCMLVMAFTNTDAGRKRGAKSGKIKNNLFTDNKYNFQISIPDGWKGKTQKENSVCRVDITCEKYKKSDLRTFGADAVAFELLIPMVSVWIIETGLSSKEYFEQFLINPSETSINQKILNSMQAGWTDMHFEQFQTFSFNKISSNIKDGVSWVGMVRSSFRSNGVEGDYPSAVIVDCIENDNKSIMFIVGRAEPEYFNIEKEMMKKIMRSVTWDNSDN